MSSDPQHGFDDWAPDYEGEVRQSEADDSFPFAGYGRVLDRVVDLTDARPGMNVLDLGTGTGRLAARFAALGCPVLAADFSPEMLARAKGNVPTAQFVQVDLLGDWPPELNRRFDRIVSSYLFHEFQLPVKLDLLKRLTSHHLADGGRIVIGDIMFPNATERDAARERWKDVWDEEFYWLADEAIPAVQQTGLQVAYEQLSFCGGVVVVEALS